MTFGHCGNKRGILAAFILAVFLMAGPPAAAAAENPTPGEYEVKAAFLYNFAKFIEWPEGSFADDRSPLTICVLGDDPFGKGFDAIRSRTIQNRSVSIRQIEEVSSARGCHLLFISASEQDRLDSLLGSLGRHGILTVSDMKKFTSSGGMIAFVTENNKIRFEINIRSANRAGITIRSQLLKLARIVIE